jgi:hypothetical protein
MSSDYKSKGKVRSGVAATKGQALVLNGSLKITNVAGTPTGGAGESRIKGGTASKNEVEVINGALKVVLV